MFAALGVPKSLQVVFLLAGISGEGGGLSPEQESGEPRRPKETIEAIENDVHPTCCFRASQLRGVVEKVEAEFQFLQELAEDFQDAGVHNQTEKYEEALAGLGRVISRGYEIEAWLGDVEEILTNGGGDPGPCRSTGFKVSAKILEVLKITSP